MKRCSHSGRKRIIREIKGGMVTSVKAMMLAKAGKNSEPEATVQQKCPPTSIKRGEVDYLQGTRKNVGDWS